ncbi:alcohol dehydrogenase class IV [Streptomyces sp. B4I13]|uniref:daptide-type RiPP biosynthesis dehydogenase n=1 Tax=Streptomyces sp. B4I13 TaxID=3042271 RepID=UPI002783CF4B|nr:daptide-type RiPP biosynthesis dehydogenase [Streptomyces sp. B4I13]MDQ0960417.1 alcohol dehydrogenase class IV [Streptomyces sp. B4I13]
MPVSLDAYDRIPPLLRELRPTGVTVLADPAVADHAVTRNVTAEIVRAGFTPTVAVTPADGGMRAVEARASRFSPGELVVGVGGGSTLDFAKLSAAVGRRPGLLRYLTSAQRSGLVALPLTEGEHAEVLAVPTTLGTGSEAGPVACFPHEDGKRIAMGECLRPRAALRVPEATETLPGPLVLDGVLEAIFRTVIPYSSDTLDLPEQDAAVEELAGELLTAGDALARRLAAGLPAPAPERLRVARLSAESQRGAINVGRSPYAVKCWALANELSTTLGLAKMRAVAALWPVVWRQALRGDTRFGSADRVHRLWERLGQRAPWLAPRPDDGLEQLMRRWRIDRTVHLAPHLRHHVALRSVRAWGAGLPTLAGLSADDVVALLAEATEPTAFPAGSPEPLPAA